MTEHEHERHAYVPFDRGGVLKPGLVLAKNTTGKPERVYSPRELRDGKADQ